MGQFRHVLSVVGSNLVAGTDGGGIYLSTDNGTTWTQPSDFWFYQSLCF